MILRNRKIVEMVENKVNSNVTSVNVDVDSHGAKNVDLETELNVNMQERVSEHRNVGIYESSSNVQRIDENRDGVVNAGTIEAFVSLMVNQFTELNKKIESIDRSNKELGNKIENTNQKIETNNS